MEPICVMSFGFLYGIPQADMVIDVRGLQNPFYVPELKEKTGLDGEVRDYVFSFPESGRYLRAAVRLLCLRVRQYQAYLALHPEKATGHLTFAIGCTGGRHRSVAMAAAVARALEAKGFPVAVEHRERWRWKED